MSKYIPGNQKHLTLDDRIYIQNEFSFKDILWFFCADTTTIFKEKLFSFLMNRNTEDAVRLFCGQLEKCFDTYDFQSQFGYILADRGSTFDESESLGTEFMGI